MGMVTGGAQVDRPASNERPAPTSTVLYRKEYTREALAFFSVVATTGTARLRKKPFSRDGCYMSPDVPHPISPTPYHTHCVNWSPYIARPLDQVLGTPAQHGVDAVEVAVFDPQEVYSAVAQQRGQHTLLLTLHKQRHEMVDLRHGHITFVVPANQGLRVGRKALGCRILFSLTLPLPHIHWPLFCLMEGIVRQYLT